MINPYFDQGFLSFFSVLAERLWQLVTGSLAYSDLAQDELQIGVLLCVSISGCVIGSHLVFRKLTMVANSISHTILLGIVGAWLLFPASVLEGGESFSISSAPLVLAAVAMGIFTTYLIYFFQTYAFIAEDASISIVFTTLFALGILFVSLFIKNSHLGAEAVLGNVDALSSADLYLSLAVFIVAIVFTLFFYKELLAGSFDLLFTKSFLPVNRCLHLFLLVLLSVFVVAGFRAVGVLLVLGFLVLPAHIALLFVRSYKELLLYSSLISSVVVLFSVAMTRALLTNFGVALSTGGFTVTVLFTLYLISLIYSSFRASLMQKKITEGFK